MKYHGKLFSFWQLSNWNHYLHWKIYHCKHFGWNSLLRNINNTSTYKVLIKVWQSINKELLKIEYLIIFSQYFANFTQEFFVVWPHDCLCKISKILAEFSKVFNFEKSLIHALAKFNWNLMSAGCYLYFSTGNLTQNVYNGKFFNVSNENILTDARH